MDMDMDMNMNMNMNTSTEVEMSLQENTYVFNVPMQVSHSTDSVSSFCSTVLNSNDTILPSEDSVFGHMYEPACQALGFEVLQVCVEHCFLSFRE